MRLKRKKPDHDYPPDNCAAARCDERADVVDATGRLAKGLVPLCEHHWQVSCDEDEEDDQRCELSLPSPLPDHVTSDQPAAAGPTPASVLPGQMALPL